MKKINILMLGTLSLVLLSGCDNNDSSTKVEDESQTSSVEETNPLEVALKAAQAEKVSIKGTVVHTYHYNNPSLSTKDVERDSSFTVSFQEDAWNFANLDSGSGKTRTYVTYFKDEYGFLSEEYLEADNTIGLAPVLTNGSKELFASKYENPFNLLSVDDFVKEGETYILSDKKAEMFVSHAFNEAFVNGKIIFTVSEGTFSSIIGSDFVSSDYLYAKEDAYGRDKGLSFEGEVLYASSIHHISTEKDKGNTNLETALAETEWGNFRIQNGTSATSMGFDVYFDGTNILATFNVGAKTPSEDDMYFTPGDDGLLDLYLYSEKTSSWVALEDSEFAGEIYLYPTTYEEMAPKMYEVSANVFSKSSYSNAYSSVSTGTKYIGKYFISTLYDHIGYSQELFRNSLVSFQLSNITTNSFDIAVKSSYSGSGYTVNSDAYFQVSDIGTCRIPYKVTLG